MAEEIEEESSKTTTLQQQDKVRLEPPEEGVIEINIDTATSIEMIRIGKGIISWN